MSYNISTSSSYDPAFLQGIPTCFHLIYKIYSCFYFNSNSWQLSWYTIRFIHTSIINILYMYCIRIWRVCAEIYFLKLLLQTILYINICLFCIWSLRSSCFNVYFTVWICLPYMNKFIKYFHIEWLVPKEMLCDFFVSWWLIWGFL